MSIFEQYGIKEVADVCLYAIELDENDNEIYVPVMYLDTLKISNIEETAEQTSARGGLGNAELIIWDYGKEITVTLEDALYTPASQGMTWGGELGVKNFSLYGILTDMTVNESYDAQIELIEIKDFFTGIASNQDIIFTWMGRANVIASNGISFYKDDLKINYTKDKGWFVGAYSGGAPLQEGPYQFVLSTEKNSSLIPPQEAMYQMKTALKNVYYLDRIEKCRATQTFVIDADTNTQHNNYRYREKYSQCELTVFLDPRTMLPYEPNTDIFVRKNGTSVTGNLRIIKQNEIYYKWTRTKAIDNSSLGQQIVVNAATFPGTYRLVGETYSRSRKTGKDQRFQFEIPLCKMGTENNFTLEAEGEPTTFNMTLKVLRREDGTMMKLTQYNVEEAKYDGYTSGSTKIVSDIGLVI